MSTPNITKWIGMGLLGLPIFGVLTFWSAIDPQPDPSTHYEAWSRYVTTDYYLIKHLLGSVLGMIFAMFGTVALGARLANSRAGRLGLVAMVITFLGYALFLTVGGVSTFAAPQEGQAYLAGIEEYSQLPPILAITAQGVLVLLAPLLLFVGNVLLGVAVWRSGTLPRWAGALWVAAQVLMLLLGQFVAIFITNSTPPTVWVGALLLVIGGAWMAWSVLRRPSSAEAVSVQAQPRVQ